MSPDTERTRALVRRVSGSAGREALLASLHDDLGIGAPPFLPYGGVHHGIAGFAQVLEGAGEILDRGSVLVESVGADGDRAFRTLRARMVTTGTELRLAKEMTVRDGRIAGIRVYWFDPTPMGCT